MSNNKLMEHTSRSDNKDYTVFVFTHDLLGDPFWKKFQQGLKDAESQFAIQVNHFRVDRYTPGVMSKLISDAVAQGHPSAILSTIPVPEEVEKPLLNAINLGIPVLAVNARDPRPVEFRIPYLLFIGAEDKAGGQLAAKTLLKNYDCCSVLVVDHYEWKQTCHSDRYAGIEEVMQHHEVVIEKLSIDGSDLEGSITRIRSALRKNPKIAGVLTLGPPGASAVLGAMESSNRSILINHVTFDLSPEQEWAILGGEILAAIDCQQYLQAFLGVGLASIYLRSGSLPTGDILTGPIVVDNESIGSRINSFPINLRDI